MFERTTDSTKPHIRINRCAGGHRSDMHVDFWSVVQIDPTRGHNDPNKEKSLELVPMREGRKALARALARQSDQTRLPVLKAI